MGLSNFYADYKYLYFHFCDLSFMRKDCKVYQNGQNNLRKGDNEEDQCH